jgi:PHD/YefM family antitoxin component YafN of YafNO toxin-antitoxin module
LAKSVLSAQEWKLLSERRDILEELLETEEVLRDKALTRSIRDSQEDVEAGRLYTIEQLKSKLRREGKPVALCPREAS